MTLYRIAGHTFGSNVGSERLAHFAVGASDSGAVGSDLPSIDLFPQRVFRSRSDVAGASREVECRWGEGGYRLRVEGVATFFVAADGASIAVDRGEDRCADEVLAQALVGPALLLAMAMRGVYCLHASCVSLDGAVVALLGASGAGKSTLARELTRLGESRWQRLADDVLPVSMAGRPVRAVCRSDYPQMSPVDAEHPPPGRQHEHRLQGVFVLDGPTDNDEDGVGSSPVAGAEATRHLIRHTIASRVFAAPLLADHLSFCADLAERVPVRRLHYPWREAALPQVARLLERRLRKGY